MRKLIVFNVILLDSCFVVGNGDISWAHDTEPEFHGFTRENAGRGGELLFGRKTCDIMVSYWPIRAAKPGFGARSFNEYENSGT